jgi:hypothetical protein
MKKTLGVLVGMWLICLSGSESAGRDLIDLIPSLYGGDGIILRTTGGAFEHAPHFTIASAASINRLNETIAAEIATFPFSSSAGGFTFSFDPGSGTFVRSTESLGPLFAERAPTLGSGKFNLNFAFTFFRYDEFEGDSLDNLQVVSRHQPDVLGSPTENEDFELDVILLSFDIDIRVQIWSFAVNYGITDRLEIGIFVPLVRVEMEVGSEAEIVESDSNRTGPGIHQFGDESPRDSASDSAFGFGDVILRAKYHLVDSPLIDASGAMLVKLATGDEDNFLGTGDTTIRPFFILSRTFNTFTPHINLGYEFNINNSDRNSLEYAFGFDFGVLQRFTIIWDLLGSHELQGDGIGDHILNTAIGVKWNPFAQFVVTANIQLPLNDDGLRARVIPTFVVEHTF